MHDIPATTVNDVQNYNMGLDPRTATTRECLSATLKLFDIFYRAKHHITDPKQWLQKAAGSSEDVMGNEYHPLHPIRFDMNPMAHMDVLDTEGQPRQIDISKDIADFCKLLVEHAPAGKTKLSETDNLIHAEGGRLVPKTWQPAGPDGGTAACPPIQHIHFTSNEIWAEAVLSLAKDYHAQGNAQVLKEVHLAAQNEKSWDFSR